MPNTKQAKKRMRQTETRRQSNKVVVSAMRSAVKKVLQAEDPEAAQAGLADAMKKVDKAAKKSVLHKNTAARKKSQLARAANKKA